MKKLPAKFQRLLWSYDIRKMDAERNKGTVITQVLNYGTWADIKLLERIYCEKDLKKIVAAPQRGVWFEKVLNFWTLMLGIKLRKRQYNQALIKINEIPRSFNRKPAADKK